MKLLHRLIVVRADCRETLRAILRSPDRWPMRTAVMLDRRRGPRRVRTQEIGIERRERPRRATPDATWHTHGFVEVEIASLPTHAVRLPGPRAATGA